MSTKRRSGDESKPDVRIVFDGVMAVGPGHPEKGTRPGPFFGVMARATRRLSDRTQRLRALEQQGHGGRKKKSTVEELYTPMHVPTVFTLLEPAHDSRPADQIFQLSPLHPKWYLWHPIRERLEFRFDGDGKPGKLTYKRGKLRAYPGHVGTPPKPLTLHGIENVPDLREIWPERSVLLDGLLSADPGVSDKVATQVFVPYGTVAGAGTLERGEPLDVVFDPARAEETAPSLIVPNAAVTVRAHDIEIASYSLDSGDRLDSIKLRATQNAEIYVSNGDPSDVEIDMRRLAIEIAQRILEEEGVDEMTEEAKQYADFLRERLGLEREQLDKFVATFHGGSTVLQEQLARPRFERNVDIDFELYYKLMKNEHLEHDGKGLPIPKRPNERDVFRGPNCYISVCETDDRLTFKSNA